MWDAGPGPACQGRQSLPCAHHSPRPGRRGLQGTPGCCAQGQLTPPPPPAGTHTAHRWVFSQQPSVPGTYSPGALCLWQANARTREPAPVPPVRQPTGQGAGDTEPSPASFTQVAWYVGRETRGSDTRGQRKEGRRGTQQGRCPEPRSGLGKESSRTKAGVGATGKAI